jgi:hypothetical protein
MNDEAANRSFAPRNAGGGVEGGSGEQSPLQTRAAFLQNWDWQSVVRLNRGACERGGAQHGPNRESFASVEQDWNKRRALESTLGDALDFLRRCHRRAPFFFYNGNTFAEIGRTLSDFLFADLPRNRRREATSSVAHYIAGVLEREMMDEMLMSLCEAASFKPGDRVQTLRGRTSGVILRLMDDGRVGWRPEGGGLELMALPETLIRRKKPGR